MTKILKVQSVREVSCFFFSKKKKNGKKSQIFNFPIFFFYSGSPLNVEDPWTDFMSTRTFSTLNIVRDVKCNVLFSSLFAPLRYFI